MYLERDRLAREGLKDAAMIDTEPLKVGCARCHRLLTLMNPPKPPTAALVVCPLCGHRFAVEIDPQVWADLFEGGQVARENQTKRGPS